MKLIVNTINKMDKDLIKSHETIARGMAYLFYEIEALKKEKKNA